AGRGDGREVTERVRNPPVVPELPLYREAFLGERARLDDVPPLVGNAPELEETLCNAPLVAQTLVERQALFKQGPCWRVVALPIHQSSGRAERPRQSGPLGGGGV